MLSKIFSTVAIAVLFARVEGVCPSAPTFVNPLTLQDGPTTFGDIFNNKLSVAIRFNDAFAEPNLVETKNDGTNNAQVCQTYPTSSGPGFTRSLQTRGDGCKVAVYTIDLPIYLNLPVASTGIGCGTVSTTAPGVATSVGHFNILHTDTSTTGRAPAGQIALDNLLLVQFVTPLQLTAQTVFSADADSVIEDGTFSVQALFTRPNLGNSGSVKISWTTNLRSQWKRFIYDTATPLGVVLNNAPAYSFGAQVTTINNPSGQTWTGTIHVPINNFCGTGVSNPAGTYTIKFLADNNNAGNPDTPATLSFALPDANLCATYSPAPPTMNLVVRDALTDAPVVGNLQLGKSYYFLATVTSVFPLSSYDFAAFPETIMTQASTSYNILPGSQFFVNQQMSKTLTTTPTGATLKLAFTVENGPSTDPVQDWFFLNSEFSSTSVTKTFDVSVKVNLVYVNDQNNGFAKRDRLFEMPDIVVVNQTIGISRYMDQPRSGALGLSISGWSFLLVPVGLWLFL